MKEELLYGRQLLIRELPPDFDPASKGKLQSYPAFEEKSGKWFCRRCGSRVTPIKPTFCQCGQECGYCTQCIQMGKVKRCLTFYHIGEENRFPKIKDPLAWQGKLSTQQDKAAQDIVQAVLNRQTLLVWAVAGAGKTEMLFKGLALAIEKGYRIGLASPRVDVCLELYPRLQAAFPKLAISLLYGQMEEDYAYRQMTIATTHQLLRFKQAFDLLIIDEIDAFPFDTDLVLQRAADQARKEESALIYLTATPNRQMQKQIKQKKIQATILPARYHGHPLPVPQLKRSKNWQANLLKKAGKTPVDRAIASRLQAGRRFLIFLPNIAWSKQWEGVLEAKFPQANFATVHAQDPDRKSKVMAMRRQELDFLVTTTILERGVTFPNIDVLVVGACDRVFTESSLVQISGRVGRSPDYPTGDILFFYHETSLAMKRAVKQIKQMNKLARKRGLLHEWPMYSLPGRISSTHFL